MKAIHQLLDLARTLDSQEQHIKQLEQQLQNPLQWVKLKKWCEMSGDTPPAIYARISKKIWREGLHYSKTDAKTIWINTEESQKWINSKGSTHVVIPSASKYATKQKSTQGRSSSNRIPQI